MWVTANAKNFNQQDLMIIRDRLEKMEDDKFLLVQTASFKDPTTILLIAIFLGWERFWLDDVGLGILKILTCYGCGIWGLIDMFTAQNRARKYNYQQFLKMTSMM